MQRRNFLINFILWILSFVFGYKIGNDNQPHSDINVNLHDGLSTSEKIQLLNEQLADVAINIKSFGAKTDGTDATNAFIAARAKSKYIFVPSGIFVVDNLSLQDTVLYGNGTIKWKSNSTSYMLELKGQSIIKGLTFDGNASSQAKTDLPAIKLTNADKTTIRDNIFTNFHSKLIVSDVANSTNVQILHNRFNKCGTITGCDVVTVRSSNWMICGNSFTDIGNGHCIRLGLYNSDSTKRPIEGITISDNQFKDTQHVGITCEIYSQNILITGNIFDHLKQAIKCESSGNTVSDITISNNIIRNIKLKTALNLSVRKVKFTNNRCNNLAGGPFFGDYFDCSHNEFYNCGTENSGVIEASGNSKHGVVTNNFIVNPKYRGVVLSNGIITGNHIIDCPDQAIRLTNSGVIVNNYISGASTGIFLVSTTTNTVVENNVLNKISGSGISYTNNASFQTVVIKENVGDSLTNDR